MRKATDLELKQFITYRSLHIALVERLGALVFDEDYSDHDWDKCTCTEEELNLLALRNAMLNGNYNPQSEDKKILNKLPAKHVKMNKHHPEYWDDNITVNNFSDDNPPQCMASKMPYRWIREMCCDWSAVALKKNQPLFKWPNENAFGDTRFIFTDNQKQYIVECINKIIDVVEKEHITYPGVKYDAKQIEPAVELNESMTKEDKDQILHFADEVKNHGLEYHDLPGHIAWDGLVKDGKKYPSFRESYEPEPDLVKTQECEMSGSFSTSAPEKVIKIVDPSGTLDEEKEDTN